MDITHMDIKGAVEIIAAIQILLMPFAVMAYRIRTASKGFSVHVIQFTAVGMIVPALIILSLTEMLDKQTLGTLLGGLVGYLLSNVTETGE